MNKRIRELFETRTYPSFPVSSGHNLRRKPNGEYVSDSIEDHWQTFQEAAEAIVQECLLSLEPDPMSTEIDYDVEEKFYRRSARKIKQHFGIQE